MPWIFVCEVPEQTNQREQFFLEDIKVKPPYGEEWRRVMWKMGHGRAQAEAAAMWRLPQLAVDVGEGALDEHRLCREKAILGDRWPGRQEVHRGRAG